MCIITATAVATALSVSTAVASTIATVGNVALAVGAIATVAGSVVGGISSYQQGKAEAAALNYNAQVARQNEEIAKNNAAMERQAGLEEARKQRMATLQAIGSQEVSLAANGVDIGYGTSLDLIEDTAELGELDALLIQQDAEKRARNYEIQANNFANEARLADFQAINAKQAGTMGLTAGIVKGVGQAASSIGGGIFNAAGGFGALGSAGTKMSGGFDVSNKAVVQGGLKFV